MYTCYIMLSYSSYNKLCYHVMLVSMLISTSTRPFGTRSYQGPSQFFALVLATNAARRKYERLAEYGWKPHRILLAQHTRSRASTY